jgi:hypothetical protein
MDYYISRNRSTGKYHFNIGNAPRCSKSVVATKAQRDEVQKAGNHMFCDKCFKMGKPDADYIAKRTCE